MPWPFLDLLAPTELPLIWAFKILTQFKFEPEIFCKTLG